MLTGSIDHTHGGINPAWIIRVDGLTELRFMGYTKRGAIARYREVYGLKGKHIEWRDYTAPGMPHNAYEAVMRALQHR